MLRSRAVGNTLFNFEAVVRRRRPLQNQYSNTSLATLNPSPWIVIEEMLAQLLSYIMRMQNAP